MSDVNAALGASGAGELVEALGKVWSLQHVGPAVRAKFSAWCRLRARQGVLSSRAELDPESYAESLAAVNAEIGAGDYEWGSPLNPAGMGPGVLAALRGEDGKLYLLGLLLEKGHGKVDPGQVLDLARANPEGVGAALRAAMGLSAPAGDDPKNPPAPGS